MKKTIKLAVVAALALGTTSAFATNGSNLMGIGIKARGMGGTAIGIAHGAESALANPALISSVKNAELSFGGTVFMPDVQANMGAGSVPSTADMNLIPEVSYANKVNDNFWMGIGMWGTAGMGVDYRDQTGFTSNFNMITNLAILQFGVPMAYKTGNFSVGITPLMQYGALDMSFGGTLDTSSAFAGGMAPAASSAVGFDDGISQDLKFGYTLGMAYEMGNMTLGASYKSKIDMDYQGQVSGASAVFAAFGAFGGTALSDELSTPAEIGVGASYKMGSSTIAVDYKNIKWSDARGYSDFKWEDQNVIALGYQYHAGKDWSLRLGYNHASNPVKPQAPVSGMDWTGSAINMFNALGFPAIVESHYSIGGCYHLTDSTRLDLAYTYAPEVTETYSTAGFAGFGPDNPQSVVVKHSQTGISAAVTINF